MYLYFMNWVPLGGSTTFETKSSYCQVARHYTAVARLGFKRRATAMLKSNLIWSVVFGMAVAQRLKRVLWARNPNLQVVITHASPVLV